MRRPLSWLLAAAGLFMLVDCTNPSQTSGSGGTSSSSSSGAAASGGGCAAGTPYCATYNICLNPSCPFWCQPASGGPTCDTTRSAALVAACGASTIHDGCDAASSGSGSGGGTGTTSGSSSSGATGGCPAGYPVACPGSDICCPSNFPVCGGGCGYNCCASGTASSSSSSSGSSSSGSGGGSQCHDFNSCVTGSDTTAQSGTSCTGEEVYATITNGCGQAAYCRLCPVANGTIDEDDCSATTIQAGQTQSGESSGLWWCNAQSVKYSCAAVTDPTSCVQF